MENPKDNPVQGSASAMALLQSLQVGAPANDSNTNKPALIFDDAPTTKRNGSGAGIVIAIVVIALIAYASWRYFRS